jgi:hypothetical protein
LTYWESKINVESSDTRNKRSKEQILPEMAIQNNI